MRFKEKINYKSNSMIKVSLENISEHPFHLHEDSIEIICILDGELYISDSASDYHLKYGDIYIFNPRDPHKLLSPGENIVLTLHIDQKYYSNYFSDMFSSYFVCDSYTYKSDLPSEIKDLRFLLATIYFEYIKESSSDHSLESIALKIISLLLEEFNHYTYIPIPTGGFEIARQSKEKLSNPTNLKIYNIIDYICENYYKKIRLEEIARNEYLSVSHLSRCIKQVSGMTFSQLISLTKCEEAERLLCNTSKTIDHIARDVGFSSRKELAFNFNRWYLKNPSSFRNDLQNSQNQLEGKRSNTFDYSFAIIILNTYLDGY